MPIIGRGGVVAHEISAPGMGSGGTSTEDWVRPADWITLPTLVDGNEKVVGVYAVYNHDSNFVAFRCSGAYTVDWGDGGAPEDVASNTTAEHCYDSDDYAALGAGTDCSRGYRQALITITPQAGQQLTAVSFNYKHSQARLNTYGSQWLDVAVAGQNITSLFVSGTTSSSRMLEQFRWVGAVNASLTSLASLFKRCSSLQTVELFDTTNVTIMNNMFDECFSLRTVPLLQTGNVTVADAMFASCYSLRSVAMTSTAKIGSMYNMFYNCYSLKDVTAIDASGTAIMNQMFTNCRSLQTVDISNTANVTDMGNMFDLCASLQYVPPMDTGEVTNMKAMFASCHSLQSVPLFDTSGASNMTNMFYNCSSLGAAPLQGTVIDHSFAGCKLSRDELVAIFQGLGTVTGKTITITGNWGVPYLSAADKAIATGKGWTIAE